MDAILLAGGYGTRLRPLTYTRPKPLLPVAGRPMLEWVVGRLPAEVDRVVVAVNWLADDLRAYFEARPGDGREFLVVEEDEPMGTAGAVMNCRSHIASDRFFVLNADIVSDMDLAAMVEQHRGTGGWATIALKEVPPEEVHNYGVVALDAADPNRIRDFVEKPKTQAEAPSRLINAGAYLLDAKVLDLIPEGFVSMEKEIFPQLLPKGLHGWSHAGMWVDVGDPRRLRQASMAVDPGYRHGPGARLGEDAVFLDSVAGRNLRVGRGSRVEGCVLGDDVSVKPDSFLLDCVVGDGEAVGGVLHGKRVWTRPRPEGYPEKQIGNVLA